MVQVRTGDIFESEAQTLVNTVNCVGVMGKGIALEFKRRFPDMYDDYARRCAAGEVQLGRPYLYKRLLLPWILNFPTKEHWRSPSRMNDIIESMRYLYRHYRRWGITSMAVPPLGCGHGQLDWEVVGPTLYNMLKHFAIPIDFYAPHGTPAHQLEQEYLEKSGDKDEVKHSEELPKMDPSWVALVSVVDRLKQEPHHWPIGRVLFQKIAYFATVLGLPTRLTFHRGAYGPYSSSIKSIISRLLNNAVIEERPLGNGNMISIELGSTYRDAYKKYEGELASWDSTIDRLTDIFLRMSTKKAELAATVHFAADSLKSGPHKPTEVDVLNDVLQWKGSKFERDQVAAAIRHMSLLGLVDAAHSDALDSIVEVGCCVTG